jgi:hypothetical protein
MTRSPGHPYTLHTVPRGNVTEYIRARLKDKHPELYEQVVNKEITAAEAARRAGISKRKRRAEVYPDDINRRTFFFCCTYTTEKERAGLGLSRKRR